MLRKLSICLLEFDKHQHKANLNLKLASLYQTSAQPKAQQKQSTT